MMKDIKSFLRALSNHAGVYQMLDSDGSVIYVGKAKNIKKRLSSYFSSQVKDVKTTTLIKNVFSIQTTITRSENEALLLECNLIKKHKPRYNVLLRDDKSFPYIHITDEAYPRIDFYRGSLKKSGQFFGPYPSASAVRKTIHLIQKVFQLRTCQEHFFKGRDRPCLHHQIGLCSGSCAGLITPDEYQQNVRHAILFLQGKDEEILNELNKQMEAASKELHFEKAAKMRDQIKKMREIQQKQHISSGHGDADVIGYAKSANQFCLQLLMVRAGRILGSRSYFPRVPFNSSEDEVLSAFISQHYLSSQVREIPKEIIIQHKLLERELISEALSEMSLHKVTISTGVRSERLKWLEMATANAEQALASHINNKANITQRFVALQQALTLPNFLKRIECFDISHSSGEETVASCVVFNDEGPVKSDYRRFNIKSITPGDDVAAMEQVLKRRYRNLKDQPQKIPDIVLIDGGLGQLNRATQVFHELECPEVLLIGVAKGTTRKPGFEMLHVHNTTIQLPADSMALHLIQQIRDEAHRFAITGHRLRRDKKRKTSMLQSIPGIGAKRRRELLRYFGGIQSLNRASLDEIAKVPGISKALAERIFEALHNVVM